MGKINTLPGLNCQQAMGLDSKHKQGVWVHYLLFFFKNNIVFIFFNGK